MTSNEIVGDGVTDKSAELAAAVALGHPIRISGVLVIGTPTVVTAPIVDTNEQIFDPAAQVTIDNGMPVRPEWFGSSAGNIRRAVNALPSTGGTVLLAPRRYPPSYSTLTGAMVSAGTGTAGTDYLAKANVRIQGSRLPTYKSDFSGLENGSIIDGPFFAFANGLELDLIGVDSGPNVCASRYGGVEQEGLLLCSVNHASPSYVSGVHVGRVRALCKSPTAAVHACLIEAIDGGVVEFAEGAYATHGIAVKSKRMKIGVLSGLETGGESVILKSDSYGVLDDVQVACVSARSNDSTQDGGFGLLIEAVTSSGGAVSVGSVRAWKKATGVCVRSNGAFTTDVNIGSVLSDFCSIGALLDGDVRRVQIGEVVANNSTSALQVNAGVTDPSCSVGMLKVANAADGVYAAGKISISEASFDTCTNYAINHATTGARVRIGDYRVTNTSNFWGLQPALAGTWVNEGGAGNPVFRVVADAGRVKVSGFIKGGGSSTVVSGFSVQIRPPENLRFVCAGFNGATLVPVEVQVSTTGNITIPNYTSAPTFISLDGVEWPIPA
jgi:hypothetical protein